MEKKFTRAMVCEEFKSKCRECPLFCDNNFKSLPCWLLDESDIQDIMKDYPYVDVKIRMIFNDIETRLTTVENKVENNVSVEFRPERVVFGCSYNRDIGFSAEVVDKKLYDKLEAKHEADCRLISEYDLENKKLKEINASYWDIIKKRVYDLNNVENERNYYKGLYSSKCDDYDKLLKDYKLLSESNNNHATDNIELEGKLEEKSLRIVALEGKLRNQRTNLASLQEKYDDACKMNKMREDVFNSNLKLKKTIEAKDREIDLLRAELDKYKTDECDDSWID